MSARRDPVGRAIRGQLTTALLAFAAGVCLLLVAASSTAGTHFTIVVAACGAALVLYGIHALRRVRARRHGRVVEAHADRHLVAVLRRRGIDVIGLGIPVRGLGDVDALVERKGRRAAIEIKSFRYWDSSERCRHARVQAGREAAATHAAFAIVWLPDGHARGLFTHPVIRLGSAEAVVLGPPETLAHALRRLL
ncbi:MAG TPA: hypothetical protein VFQ88_09445 [Nevskiaceae bacterium]|nr:hypothetical protein [Nevskiaceae bacterium]